MAALNGSDEEKSIAAERVRRHMEALETIRRVKDRKGRRSYKERCYRQLSN